MTFKGGGVFTNEVDSSYTGKTTIELGTQLFVPTVKGFGGGIQKDDARIKEFFNDKYDYIEFDNSLFYNKEKSGKLYILAKKDFRVRLFK